MPASSWFGSRNSLVPMWPWNFINHDLFDTSVYDTGHVALCHVSHSIPFHNKQEILSKGNRYIVISLFDMPLMPEYGNEIFSHTQNCHNITEKKLRIPYIQTYLEGSSLADKKTSKKCSKCFLKRRS